MRVPVSWLRDFVRTAATVDAIAEALTSRGFTVDAVERQPTPDRIVVGLVETLDRHPNADRLRVARVKVGTGALQIVTGADNVKAGDKVPIALEGAVVFARRPAADGTAATALPATKTILKSALRGVESDGMMCSADELALPGEFDDGIIIMEDDAEIGADFWKAASFGDAVLDVDVPANRADCLSIVGLARELAAAVVAGFVSPRHEAPPGSRTSPIEVKIEDAEICRRFDGIPFAIELAASRSAIARDMPVLGICGGEQLLAVALGGTLIQHIPDEVADCLAHRQPNPRDEPGHTVRIIAGTLLHRITAAPTLAVNSAHHQAVKAPGQGVVIDAVADDGVIEGIEDPRRRFCLGVQWHPEFALSEGDRRIFRAFVEAAGG